MPKQDIKNFSLTELENYLKTKNIASFRAKQIFKWVYLKQTDSFEEMTDLSKDFRKEASELFSNKRLETKKITSSKKDGSKKFLFCLEDKNYIESVLIPEKDHYTLCISTQAGCRQNCKFCMTAKSGFKRNLSTSEIISQIRDTQKYLIDLNEKNPKRLSNIVFMGMGEPLDNYDNVLRAIRIITDQDYGLKISRRKITISTSGLVPEIEKLGRDSGIPIAVSLNAVNDKLRTELMPVNKRYPLSQLLSALKNYPMAKREKITFEYILIKGINDSYEDAKKLAVLLRGMKAKINLIPFNPHQGVDFERPDKETIEKFGKILLDKGYTVIVRWSKGDDIGAACGQLSASHSD
ncbi:MAG: 23S rRNA (adenine(2503)-C(2))-methyltransferase RlmN [Desulforegulaceae bacterium]|nr:23S rRNA (adenine(2503)-C(2))-methyltransferase RlmN [Desulforegulaceae bacterium]